MTRDRDFKRIVRQRMAKTGESYSAARQQLIRRDPRATLDGWAVTGPGDGTPGFQLTDYAGGLDPDNPHGGLPSAFLRSLVPAPASHAVIMQTISSERYRGQRIRFSAFVRTDAAATSAGLWVRVVPEDRDVTLASGRERGGDTWRRCSVVLDVPAASTSIMFGLWLQGRGQAWMSDARFEVVDASVPVTGGRAEPLEPVNLSFLESP